MKIEFTEEEQRAINSIRSEKLKGIYVYLVYNAQNLQNIRAEQRDRETKLSFLYLVGERPQQHFSFIVNSEWLLFYIEEIALNNWPEIEERLRQHGIECYPDLANSRKKRFRVEDEKPLIFIREILTDYDNRLSEMA